MIATIDVRLRFDVGFMLYKQIESFISVGAVPEVDGITMLDRLDQNPSFVLILVDNCDVFSNYLSSSSGFYLIRPDIYPANVGGMMDNLAM